MQNRAVQPNAQIQSPDGALKLLSFDYSKTAKGLHGELQTPNSQVAFTSQTSLPVQEVRLLENSLMSYFKLAGAEKTAEYIHTLISTNSNILAINPVNGWEITDSVDQKIGKRRAPNPLSGSQVAGLLEQLWPSTNQTFREHLCHSNVVLTLAGMKGQTEFFIPVSTPDTIRLVHEGIKNLNRRSIELGIPVILQGHEKSHHSASDGREYLMVMVCNLNGVARHSKSCDLPGVDAFNPATGFKGYQEWCLSTYRSLTVLQAAGNYSKETNLDLIVHGVQKGYPARAILDAAYFYQAPYEARDNSIITDSRIPFTGIYQEAQPNFFFFKLHTGFPEIRANIEESGRILEGFYMSRWHNDLKFS